MRKTILVFAMALFFGNAFIGSSFAANNNQPEVQQQQTAQNEFTAIELDELPQAVKDAVEKDDRNATLESAERKVLPNGEQVYRVTMEVEDKGQVTKSFYANGRKYDSK